jgi:guanosine-3',5'-bis(diphosphate) 3'-pyrophosphohydrolase
MDEIAERGYAAHWKYKGVSNQHDVYESLAGQRERVDWKIRNADAIEFFKISRPILFNEEVYALHSERRPMIILPKGSYCS